MNRLAKMRLSGVPFGSDLYTPPASAEDHSRPVKKNPAPACPENPPACTDLALRGNSVGPEGVADSDTQTEAPKQEAAAKSSPELVSTEPVPRGARPSVPSLATRHSSLPRTEAPDGVGRECATVSSPSQSPASRAPSASSASKPSLATRHSSLARTEAPDGVGRECATVSSPSQSPASRAPSASSASKPSLATRHSSLATDLSHHGRLCTVCSHPLRDAIEADFLRWRSPQEITREYRLGDRSTVYRHANSTGLFRRRKEQFGRVLEFFLEQAETCCLEDANFVIRAARIYSHLDHNGKWVESPRTNYVYHGSAPFPPEDPGLLTLSSEPRQQPATPDGARKIRRAKKTPGPPKAACRRVLERVQATVTDRAKKNRKAKKRLIATERN